MRIVLDTNVLISALHFGGPPRAILERIIRGTEQLYLSSPILEELGEVLQRRKIGFPPEAVEAVLGELTAVGHMVRPAATIEGILQDPDDHRVLECAVEANAEYIISGDRHLLQLGQYKGVQIVSPAKYLQIPVKAENDINIEEE